MTDIENQVGNYTKEQIEKIKEFDNQLHIDYDKFIKTMLEFTGKYSNVISGVISRRMNNYAWNINFEFDSKEIENQSIKE